MNDSDLFADVIPGQVEDGLEFEHEVVEERLVAVGEQLHLAQRVEMHVDRQVLPKLVGQGVHHGALVWNTKQYSYNAGSNTFKTFSCVFVTRR